MDQKWSQILVILVFFQKIAEGAVTKAVKEGESVEIKCQPAEVGTMIIWFRDLDESGMEFIASFTVTGDKKSTSTPVSPNLILSKMGQHILTVKAFSRAFDSGSYSCASIKSNELKFGQVTRLTGEKKAEVVTRAPAIADATQRNVPTTTTACLCPNNQETSTLPLFCSPLVLGPVAGGCALLLLLLIIAVLYCNRIRTRRCPHHHKRTPRMMAPQKQMMTNRHI